MKEFTLTIWERATLIGLIQSQHEWRKTGPAEVRSGIRLLDALELTAEEQQAVGFRELGNGAYTWDANQAQGHDVEIQLEDADYKHMAEIMRQYPHWQVSRKSAALLEKFEI